MNEPQDPFDFDDDPDDDLPFEDEPDFDDLEDYGEVFDESLLEDFSDIPIELLTGELPSISELIQSDGSEEAQDRFEQLDSDLDRQTTGTAVQDLDPAELARLTGGERRKPAAEFEDFEDFGERDEPRAAGDTGEWRDTEVSERRPGPATPADAWVDPRFLGRLNSKWDHNYLPPLELPIERLGGSFYAAALHLKPFVVKRFSFDPQLVEPPERLGAAMSHTAKQFLLWNVQRMQLDPTDELAWVPHGDFRPRMPPLELDLHRIAWDALERASDVFLGHRVAWIRSLLSEFSFQPVSQMPIIAGQFGRPDEPEPATAEDSA